MSKFTSTPDGRGITKDLAWFNDRELCRKLTHLFLHADGDLSNKSVLPDEALGLTRSDGDDHKSSFNSHEVSPKSRTATMKVSRLALLKKTTALLIRGSSVSRYLYAIACGYFCTCTCTCACSQKVVLLNSNNLSSKDRIWSAVTVTQLEVMGAL